jgi:hypothetical protein
VQQRARVRIVARFACPYAALIEQIQFEKLRSRIIDANRDQAPCPPISPIYVGNQGTARIR